MRVCSLVPVGLCHLQSQSFLCHTVKVAECLTTGSFSLCTLGEVLEEVGGGRWVGGRKRKVGGEGWVVGEAMDGRSGTSDTRGVNIMGLPSRIPFFRHIQSNRNITTLLLTRSLQ